MNAVARPEIFRVPLCDQHLPTRESLTSYIMRLAVENDVTSGQLIDRKFHGHGEPRNILCRASAMGGSVGQSINGIGSFAESFVQRTEVLTKQDGLRGSTALGFKAFTTPNGLFRAKLAWSPNYMATQEISHLPLLWAFDAVKVCHLTKSPLVSICPGPHCRRQLPMFSATCRADRCSWCGTSFEMRPPKSGATDPITASIRCLDYELWVSEQIGECIAAVAAGEEISRAPFTEVISHWFDVFEIRNPTEAAKITGCGDFAITSWMKNGRRPRLRNTLNLCWVFGVSLREFLSMRVPSRHDGKLRPSCEPNARHAATSRRIPINKAELESRLTNIIRNDIYRDLSFAEICRAKIKRREVIVREYFPHLAKIISARYLKNRREFAESRRQVYRAAIRAAALEVYQQGYVPNHKNLKGLIEPYSILRCDWAMRELKLVRTQLGLDFPDPQLMLPLED